MVQQQIVDYAKSQLKLGVGKDIIKSALIGAGWPEIDVADSLKSLEAAAGASSGPSVAGATSPIFVSDLVSSSKLEALPLASAGDAGGAARGVSAGKGASDSFPGGALKFSKSTIVIIALGVLSLILAVGVIFLYLQNGGLRDKVTVSLNESSAAKSKISFLNQQVSGLTKERDDLNSKLSALTGDNQGLKTELSFLIAPPELASSTSTPSSVSATVKGMLSGGSKSQYLLTTANGVKVYIKNYKDAKVDAALKSLVGKTVEVFGTHLPGSRDLTITSVNGTSVQ